MTGEGREYPKRNLNSKASSIPTSIWILFTLLVLFNPKENDLLLKQVGQETPRTPSKLWKKFEFPWGEIPHQRSCIYVYTVDPSYNMAHMTGISDIGNHIVSSESWKNGRETQSVT